MSSPTSAPSGVDKEHCGVEMFSTIQAVVMKFIYLKVVFELSDMQQWNDYGKGGPNR